VIRTPERTSLGSGALVWAGFDGQHAPGALLDAIRDGRVGGVLLFAIRGNVKSKAQVREMLREVLRAYPKLPDETQVFAKSRAEESIHKHDAYAERATTIGELRRDLK